MKKIILLLLLMLGILSFSKEKKVYMPKVVITVMDDNFKNPITRAVEQSGILTKALSLGDMLSFRYKSDDKKFAEKLIEEIWKMNKTLPNKLTFLIEQNEENTMVQILQVLKKYRYRGKVEVIELSYQKNAKILEQTNKNGWEYNQYSDLKDVTGEVEIGGVKYNKNECVATLFMQKHDNVKK
ncbi:hypothetical protein BCB68_07525 [Leptotrichia sp. oral taxon 498]|uniref:hypothetical protein n=1 Tax=Leptotrichia sp. oral taxon 498 TaxID=712368 RepID=UPI000B8CEDCD|nr:hypothetical protein [Leptotrichia sp. oral taxon 498]ASQ48788.1 hypothetical protein BCB68_07525 [Leptotrichia sp. oral taxon 498]